MRSVSSNQGFTLLELLITIGLLIVLFGIGGIYVNEWRPSQTHIAAVEIVRDTLREARIYADIERNNQNWDITLTATTITLTGATTHEQQVFSLPNNSVLSWHGGNTLTFTQPHGFPDTTKTLIISTGSLATTFQINEYGILEKQ